MSGDELEQKYKENENSYMMVWKRKFMTKYRNL